MNESRQVTRRKLFNDHFARYDGASRHPKESRKDRRKMARAFAAGAWHRMQSNRGVTDSAE